MKYFTLTLSLLVLATFAFGQQEELGPRHTFSAQFGYGWFGLLNNNSLDINVDEMGNEVEAVYLAKFSGSPSSTIAYDYRIGKVFSLGGAIGHQRLLINDFIDQRENRIEPGEVKLNRIFVSARTLFHYGKNPKWDLYSGVRTGLTVWNFKSTVDIEDFSVNSGTTSIGSVSTVLPHLVPIPFGVKYYPNDRLMVGSELAFGSPHFIALQVGVRL